MSGDKSGAAGYYLDPNSTLNTPDLGNNLATFAASTQGSPYADQIKSNGNNPIYSNSAGGWGTLNQSNGQFQDAPWVQDYMQWLGMNQQETTSYNAYKNLAQNQPGTEQTILTGPQAGTLQPSVLGAKQ